MSAKKRRRDIKNEEKQTAQMVCDEIRDCFKYLKLDINVSEI